jgi:hypothetical protein
MLLLKSKTAIFALAFVLSFTASAAAQEQTRFVLRLTDELVGQLREVGSLASNVEAEFREKISLIDIQFGDATGKQAQVMEVDMDVTAGLANVIVDDRLLEQIQKNPIRIQVPADKRNFSRVSLVYARGADEDLATVPVEPILNSDGEPIDMFYIRLKDARPMAGGIDGFDKFEIQTKFGKVSMPMDQVAGIKFHIDANDSAVVVLENGDTITGVPTIPSVNLTTDWGKADIEPEFMKALTTNPNARFIQESTDFGTRWQLRTANVASPAD